MPFENIPDELKAYPQWICWRYEDRGGPKPTKVPISPIDGGEVGTKDPTRWTLFDKAVEIHRMGCGDGIGFVLTTNDPFAAIDLDAEYADGTPASFEDIQRQIKIYEAFDSYAERSPSGKGLHILVRGKIPQGRKKNLIEVYSDLRYMTMTGDVFRPQSINNCNETLNVLQQELTSASNPTTSGYDAPQSEEDAAIYDKAANAENGLKFEHLFHGQWEDYYRSQSEADFALLNILAFYTHNREQIVRMFHVSELGKRDKAHRGDYLESMLNRVFDRVLPPVDTSAIQAQIQKTVEQNKQSQQEQLEQSMRSAMPATDRHPGVNFREQDELPFPPGLVGEIANYFFANAPRPVREAALTAALGLMSGIVGRAYNVSGAGLNNYFILLAETGRGKDIVHDGPPALMSHVASMEDTTEGIPAALNFLGPESISSAQALHKLVAEHPSVVAPMKEIGQKLRYWMDPRAPVHMQEMKREILSMYTNSGQGSIKGTSVYADKDKNVKAVEAPAFSLLGETAPDILFESMDERQVRDGLLPRFMLIEYTGKRPKRNRQAGRIPPSQLLVEEMRKLCRHSLQVNQSNRAIDVGMSPEAEEYLDNFDEKCDSFINNQQGPKVVSDLWTRAWLKAAKVAAVVAAGINPFRPEITLDVAQWAVALVEADVAAIARRFESGQVGRNSHESDQDIMLGHQVKQYFVVDEAKLMRGGSNISLRNQGIIPYSWLHKRLASTGPFKNDPRNATNAVKRCVGNAVDSGNLIELGPQETGALQVQGVIRSARAKYYRVVPEYLENIDDD